MKNVKAHIDLLGHRVEDCVTGFRGVVAGISFDLYCCIQAIVNPGIDASGKIGEQAWFDVNRLRITDAQRVMDLPDYEVGAIAEGKKGAAEKPRFTKA